MMSLESKILNNSYTNKSLCLPAYNGKKINVYRSL